MSKSKIEWTETTWNPVTGCTKISTGCKHCYAERMAKRLQGMGKPAYRNGFKVTCHEDRLDEPLRWRKPCLAFVCSMGDLFHEEVPLEFIDKVFAIMALRPEHTFQLLTKRPERAVAYFAHGNCEHYPRETDVHIAMHENYGWQSREDILTYAPPGSVIPDDPAWPLPNVWLGATVENQDTADQRIPDLLKCPAAVRFLSIEPMLGPIDLRQYIGYNPTHEKLKQRKRSVRGSSVGSSADQARRDDLESGRVAGESVEQESQVAQDCQAASGTRSDVPRSATDDRNETDELSSSPIGMETFSGADTGRPSNQPQKWDQEGQSPEKPRSDNAFGGCQTRSSFRTKARIEKQVRPISLCIVGGESGPGARPMREEWVLDIKRQCDSAGVPFFFKQWGEWVPFVANGPLPAHCVYIGPDGMVRVGDAENDRDVCMGRVGKKQAGRLLQGRTWDAIPLITEA